MTQNNRRWDREPISVPCKISYEDDTRNSAEGSIINLSPGGVMLSTEQGFIANERVAITLEDEYDSLLFEFAEILIGTVRWSQSTATAGLGLYHVGIALERELPRRMLLTEQ
ncbi:MAG: PilZ domain-containing protein [Desulfomicrobium sp.]|nr:PilZ domain-containing protein [Desulfomicrobium sp.]